MPAPMQSIQNSTITTANAPETISIPQNQVKLPNSPTGAKIWCTGEVEPSCLQLYPCCYKSLITHPCAPSMCPTSFQGHLSSLLHCISHLQHPTFKEPVPVLLLIAAISKLPSSHLYHPNCHNISLRKIYSMSLQCLLTKCNKFLVPNHFEYIVLHVFM